MINIELAFLGGAVTGLTNILMPALQAAATILILQYQKKQYNEIADKRIAMIEQAVNNYVASIDAAIASGAFRESFGSVPKAILYQPVDSSAEQLGVINSNLKAIPDADRQMTAVNRLVENNDIARMVALDPTYVCNIASESIQIKDLLAGKLPLDDVVEVLTDTAEQACLLGRVGNTKAIFMRNLGVSRLRAQAVGRKEFAAHNAMLNRDVSPIARQTNIIDMLQTPAQRIALALAQNQLIQQSLQNAANAEAAGDPTAYAELQVRLQKINNRLGTEAQKGNLINQFVPNYAAILQPQVKSLTESLRWGDAASIQQPNAPATPSASNDTNSKVAALGGSSLSGGQ